MDASSIFHRVKRKIKTKQEFYFGPNKLETVDDYKYLGVKFNEYLDKQVPGESLADVATRALGKLLSKYHLNKGFGLKTYTKVYDTSIVPIMDYCSGVWGFSRNEKLDKIHARATRCYLGVNKFATKVGIEGELGWTPPHIRRMLNVLRTWNRIISMENTRLPKIVYCHMLDIQKPGTWTHKIKNIFTMINLKMF